MTCAMICSTSSLLLIGYSPSVRFFNIGMGAGNDVYGFHFAHVAGCGGTGVGGGFNCPTSPRTMTVTVPEPILS